MVDRTEPSARDLREGLGACPVCGDQMLVQEYRCRGCAVVLRGAFRRCEVCALPQELVHFVNVFLEAEGNFRGVERRIGISYPTIKARLASVNARLAEGRLRADAVEPADEMPAMAEEAASRGARLDLLSEVRAGRIGVDDALRRLFQQA